MTIAPNTDYIYMVCVLESLALLDTYTYLDIQTNHE